jgi:hypothetical protein
VAIPRAGANQFLCNDGAVLNGGTLTLRNVLATDNSAADALSAGPAGSGGAIYNFPGASLNVLSSAISANDAGAGAASASAAPGGGCSGGGIYNNGGLVAIVDSTVASTSRHPMRIGVVSATEEVMPSERLVPVWRARSAKLDRIVLDCLKQIGKGEDSRYCCV